MHSWEAGFGIKKDCIKANNSKYQILRELRCLCAVSLLNHDTLNSTLLLPGNYISCYHVLPRGLVKRTSSKIHATSGPLGGKTELHMIRYDSIMMHGEVSLGGRSNR